MIKAITQVGPAALAAILLAHGPRAGATGQQPIALSGFPAAMYSLSAVESAPAQDPAAADRTERVVPAPAVQEPERPVELRGKVFGPDGKPIGGARVYLVRGTPALQEDLGVGRAWPAPKMRAVTGEAGEFQFTAPASELRGTSTPQLLALGPDTAEKVPGFGIGWERAQWFDARQGSVPGPPNGQDSSSRGQPILRLVRDDAPLAGRVVDSRGRPVGGVDVGVVEVKRMRNEDLSDYLRAVTVGNADYDRADNQFMTRSIGANYVREEELSRILRAKSDGDGRFTLRGVGRERIAYLEFSGGSVMTQRVHARTRPGPTVNIRHIYHHHDSEEFPHYGSTFEHVTDASAPVIGSVADKDSGKPIPGILVQSQQLAGSPGHIWMDMHRAVTDVQGRFRLTGLPIGDGNVIIAQSLDQPYLPARRAIPAPIGGDSKPLDLHLKRGVFVRGRVTDARTGRPIRARVDYFAPPSNENVKEAVGFEGAVQPLAVHLTDKDGRYAIPALPGRGIVGVLAMNDFYGYPLGAGAEAIEGGQGKGEFRRFEALPTPISGVQYHALAEVDASDGIRPTVRDFTLDPGETLAGTVLDAEGTPLAGTSIFGDLPQAFFYVPLGSAEFSVRQYREDKPRLLLFAHPERKLAGSLSLRGAQKRKLSVRLEPCGVAVGRVVDAKGKPLAGIVVSSPMSVGEGDGPSVARGLPERYYTTNEEGRFRIEGLAPGVPYRLVIPGSGGPPLASVAAKSGETKDLGDLIKPQ